MEKPFNIDKPTLHHYCQSLVQQKLDQAEAAMRDAQAAANEETKSSAGDKYETGRAMMQLEKEKIAHQRAELLRVKKVLDHMDPTRRTERVALGSLVATTVGWFYIAAGLGQIKVEAQPYFVISPAAPVGQLLWDKAPDEPFVFNGKTATIKQIW